MNGIHDMGGMHGFGPVAPERNEPVFHADWEGRVLALNRAMGQARLWNIDMSRAAIEVLPPDVYLTRSYYAKWLLRLEQLLLERALVDADELEAGHALRPGKPVRKLQAADVAAALTRGSYGREPGAPARFKAGDRVRTRNLNPATHTRLPRYARGRIGIIECVRGCHVFPDSVAIGQGVENPQWLYTLRFEGRELWGENCDPSLQVSIEAFEPYLEPI